MNPETNGHSEIPALDASQIDHGEIPPLTLLTARVEKLENDLEQVIWLHAELVFALKLAVATQYAQSLTPQMQQDLVDQLMAGASP